MHEYGHSFSIIRFCLCSCRRTGASPGCSPLGTCFCLGTSGNCDDRCGGIKLKFTAGKIVVSAFILKKNNLSKIIVSSNILAN